MKVSIILPPANSPGEKQDARSWVTQQRSLGKSSAEIRNEFLNLPRIHPTKKQAEEEAAKGDDALLDSLGLVVLGRDERGQIKIYSKEKRSSYMIRDIDRFKLPHLVSFAGRVVKTKITAGQATGGMTSMVELRDIIADAASDLPTLGSTSERGAGVWVSGDSITLVGDRSMSILNGSGELVESHNPKHGNLIYSLDGNPAWYDHDEMVRSLADVDDVDAVESAIRLFRRWRFEFPSAPELLTGIVMAALMQTAWTWRPQIVFTGQAESGKSILFGMLDHMFCGLSTIFSRDSTIRGIEQYVASSGRITQIDEIDKNKHREHIISMVRSSGRGRDSRVVSKSGSGGCLITKMSHIFFLAGIESGLDSTTDSNRFVRIEMLGQEPGKPKIVVPTEAECRRVGQGLLTVVLRHARAAVTLANSLGAARVEGLSTRVVETYSPPAAIYALAMRLTPESALTTFVANHQSNESAGTESDAERLISAILVQRLHCGNELKTLSVEQLVRIVSARHESVSRREDAESILQGCGIEISASDERIKINQTAVKETLLQKSEFRKSNVTEILSREKSAERISDGKKRWIVLDLELFLRGEIVEKEAESDF